MKPSWIKWARELSAIAQIGLEHSPGLFDAERYRSVQSIAAEIMADHSGQTPEYVRALFAREVGYATPKVDVRGAVFRNDEVMLVRERADGLWALPGGWADVNESPSEAVVREIQEESGYQTQVIKLLALYDRSRHLHPPYPFSVYMVCFQCEIVGGSPQTSVETDSVAFFSRDRLPKLSLDRVTPQQIERYFEFNGHPGWPSDFD